MKRIFGLAFIVILLMLLIGCGIQKSTLTATAVIATSTPAPTPTVDIFSQIRFFRGDLPKALANRLELPTSLVHVKYVNESNVNLAQIQEGSITWVYVLVAPFPTVVDGVNLQTIEKTWQGQGNAEFQGQPLLMSEQTKNYFTELWGPANSLGVTVLDEGTLLETAWKQKTAWAIIPFEDLEPQWKVLKVDGQSPIYKTLDIKTYPLVIRFGFGGDTGLASVLQNEINKEQLNLVTTNWDAKKMTTVLMTGTTTLARMVGLRMEENGITWPGQKIKEWLTEPDFRHISNEASFYAQCPKYDPWYITTTFCSKPENIRLFEDLGVNIIELTGNHLLDFGDQPFIDTLSLYKNEGWGTFGGGSNAEKARQPLLEESNGNKIAFIGCNKSDNPAEWATDTKPGAAHCDFDWMKQEIADLKTQGYLVIATLQDLESYSPMPVPYIRDDFIKVADMGADIVSGSSAHFPEGFEFRNWTFIHFGLGNLFFDQMDYPVVGTRREFLDRHVFYNGKYISTEILTALLEDYAQPRPMTPEERLQFLSDMFSVSNW